MTEAMRLMHEVLRRAGMLRPEHDKPLAAMTSDELNQVRQAAHELYQEFAILVKYGIEEW